MPRRFQPDDGVGDGQRAEKQHNQQEPQIEIVGTRRFENDFVRDVARQNGPRTNVKQKKQFENVDGW